MLGAYLAVSRPAGCEEASAIGFYPSLLLAAVIVAALGPWLSSAGEFAVPVRSPSWRPTNGFAPPVRWASLKQAHRCRQKETM